MREEAKPPISAWRTLAGSAPARGEQQALGHGLDVQRHDDLVGHLAVWPSPVAADQGDVLAHQLEQRLGALEGGGRPPTMMDSVAFLAPTSPPETGASR
jgi:hypothetical protein